MVSKQREQLLPGSRCSGWRPGPTVFFRVCLPGSLSCVLAALRARLHLTSASPAPVRASRECTTLPVEERAREEAALTARLEDLRVSSRQG